jgi:N-acetylglucosamine kinase-like BadF-type ATPase
VKLIAESGSTKTEWCLVEGIYVVEHAFTEGLNPYFQIRREISRSIRLQLPEVFFKKKIDQIYFYGAGCSSKEKKDVIRASLVTQFRAPAEVESDLLAAVRALFGNEPGIGCILGTGSNSCFYDGEKIVQNVSPLGYVLGDEGSGAVLGRLFLSDCMKGIAPLELTEMVYDLYKISPADILENVYSKPFPNRFLASFSYFLGQHLDNEYVYELVKQNFRNFFVRNILHYEYQRYPVHFMGLVAYHYAEILKEVATEFHIEVGQIEKAPMPGLVRYHTDHCRLG